MNLNCSLIPHADGEDVGLCNPSTASIAPVSVYFRDIEQHLINHIRAATHVVGCVAWLTSEPILKELAKKRMACIIIQKEDFLRPDVPHKNGWASKLRDLYSSLKAPEVRYGFPSPLKEMSVCSLWDSEAVRCVGNYNRNKAPASPRAHHKFLVFLESKNDPYENEDCYETEYRATAVWTGSFNFTKNAGQSLENALYIESYEIADAYYREWAQVTALSEPLDWESDWVAPEWRIGT
jgi:hypothetical protein